MNSKYNSKISKTKEETCFCHLCGSLSQTKQLSIDQNGYPFLKRLPPAPGALPIHQGTTHVDACYLCSLLLDKQRELNNNSANFFFKGFFRMSNKKQEIAEHLPLIKRKQNRQSSTLSIYDSCQLCSSIQIRGSLHVLQKSQYSFLQLNQVHVCKLCYYNLRDQYSRKVLRYLRPRSQCYLCQSRIDFVDNEVKLLEMDYFPFLRRLYDQSYREKYLYDNHRLALVCDACFYSLLFQYIDQDRQNINIDQRFYTWQCNSSSITDDQDLFY